MRRDKQHPFHEQEDHWIPLSDLMTGLMMFFMLLAIAFMVKVEADSEKIKEVAIIYDQLRSDLYNDLDAEFHKDLARWGAELDADLTLRFTEPDVLFDTGSSHLKPKFTAILNDFFPRYIAILASDKYRNSVTEIRVEGHTSSTWGQGVGTEDAYFKNMELSQSRTRSTLQYVLQLPQVRSEQAWLRRSLTANGLSSSKLIIGSDGKENAARSQRVEFKIRTDADARIATIIEATK
ncbi:OmpA/MotB family protein [Insolitispirillum peregrinum]|uniref:OmpA/MotB family protein n=1 Tax=Insolitispirillum peregrinum TaxID=80876 RepID=UPI003619881C